MIEYVDDVEKVGGTTMPCPCCNDLLMMVYYAFGSFGSITKSRRYAQKHYDHYLTAIIPAKRWDIAKEKCASDSGGRIFELVAINGDFWVQRILYGTTEEQK